MPNQDVTQFSYKDCDVNDNGANAKGCQFHLLVSWGNGNDAVSGGSFSPGRYRPTGAMLEKGS